MMSFEEFLNATKDRVREELPDAEVRIQLVNKLQGESYLGISVKPEGSTAAATFNVSPAYERYQADPSQESAILNKIAADAKEVSSAIPVFEVTSFTDYGNARDHLVMQVVPVDPNKELLANIPHKTVEDIAVVYRVEFLNPADRTASILVTNELMAEYGITPEQLHADAVEAQLANHPPILKNMSEMLGDMTGGLLDIPESPMWVATVEGGQNGASVTQLPGFLAQAAEKLGGDFYVLPSSVHEVLFIRDDGSFDREDLERMVRDVNDREVIEADFLSNSVYHYDSAGRIFEKADTFESRAAEDPVLYDAEAVRDTMTVLLVEPNQHPRPVEIGTELEDLQKAVGGYIEVVYPFEDQVGLIVNEEGKLDGLPLNRALRDDSGEIYDIIAGTFLVVGLTEEDFGSLSPEQIKTYEEKFHSPEAFIRMGRGIMAVPIPDDKLEKQRDIKRESPELKPQRKMKEEIL